MHRIEPARTGPTRPTLLLAAALLASCGGPLAPGQDGDSHETATDALTTKDGCWIATPGTALLMGDDDSRKVDLPFDVPYFGLKWSSLYVNSNGNVTFGVSSTSSRGRLPDGTRIVAAPLFGDLNPEEGDGLGGANDVRVAFVGTVPNRAVVVTWNQVPEYGATEPNTFQLVLSESGALMFSYRTLHTDGMSISRAPMVVGLSSGAGTVLSVASGTQVTALAGTSRTFEPDGAGSYFVRTGCFSTPPTEPVEPQNRAPLANAGPDLTEECTGPGGATVTLDGTRSSDPDGDALRSLWSEGTTTLASEAVANTTLPVGTHTVQLEVDDGHGLVATDTVDVTVTDSVAPTVSFEALEPALWPPNGVFRRVLRGLVANDACCEARLDVTVQGDPTQWRVERDADGSVDVYVRARRDGQEFDGRTYRIDVTATDCGGRTTVRSIEAVVPHDQRPG